MNRRRSALLGLVLLAALAAPSEAQTPPATPAGVPAPTPTPLPQAAQPQELGPTPSPVPAASAPPSPAAQPSPAPTPGAPTTPQPTATPMPWGFVFQPPHPLPAQQQAAGAPVILEFDLNAEPIMAPSDVRGRILTNPEVVNVTVRMFGRETAIPKVAPGDFELAGHVPSIPFFMSAFVRGRRDIEIIAAVADGRTVSITVPIRIQ
jgi:hypothetical protein